MSIQKAANTNTKRRWQTQVIASNYVRLLIPYAPRPMMRNYICLIPFLLFGQIVEEEVDEYGIDLGVWFEFENFAAQ